MSSHTPNSSLKQTSFFPQHFLLHMIFFLQGLHPSDEVIQVRNLRIIPLRQLCKIVQFVYYTKVSNQDDKYGLKPSLPSALQVLCPRCMWSIKQRERTPYLFSQGHLLLASPEKLYLSRISMCGCVFVCVCIKMSLNPELSNVICLHTLLKPTFYTG